MKRILLTAIIAVVLQNTAIALNLTGIPIIRRENTGGELRGKPTYLLHLSDNQIEIPKPDGSFETITLLCNDQQAWVEKEKPFQITFFEDKGNLVRVEVAVLFTQEDWEARAKELKEANAPDNWRDNPVHVGEHDILYCVYTSYSLKEGGWSWSGNTGIEEHAVRRYSKAASKLEKVFEEVPVTPTAPKRENRSVVAKEVEQEIEPVEAKEFRQKFEEAVKQAQTPYRKELEKELALAKKQEKPKIVAVIEAELKHLDSDDATEISVFTPEKKSLLNAKVRYKKQLETARNSYLKEMELLVKELVRNTRTEEAKIVQETYTRLRGRQDERNHLNGQKFSLIKPRRSQIAPVPVIRMTMELHADGRGRYGVSRGMSTDSPKPLFPNSPFPLSAFPKAQAFRGENGMGRIVFDFRNADPLETWTKSGWNYSFNHSIIDTQRRTLLYESSKIGRPSFSPGKFFDFPIRVTVESVVNPRGYCPMIEIWMITKNGEQACVSLWRPADASLTDKRLFSSYTHFGQDKSRSQISLPDTRLVGNQPVWTFFELPRTAVENLSSIYCDVQAGHERSISPPPIARDVEVVLLDISGKLKATTGLAVVKAGEKVMVQSVSARTAAFRAGLKQGDEIIRFNSEKRSAEQIQKILAYVKFGDPIAVAVIRNGEEKVFCFHAE